MSVFTQVIITSVIWMNAYIKLFL